MSAFTRRRGSAGGASACGVWNATGMSGSTDVADRQSALLHTHACTCVCVRARACVCMRAYVRACVCARGL